MKISRRSVLHISGLVAAALALTGCSAAGSAALGGKLPGLLKGLAKKGETAASSEAASDMAVTPPPEGEPLVPALPEYDADILTGAARSTNSRPVAVMVNNIANSQRQNARPQRGIGSADLLIEAKVEGGITRLCAVFSDADSIPEVGPLRSGRDQFLQLLMPWNILYYHDGESIFCTQFVSVYGYSGLNIGGKNYFKTPTHPFVSEVVEYLGHVLPAAIFGMLIVYCLKGVSLTSGSHGIPEAIAIGVTVALHKWRHQTLVSIAGGTLCYVLLVQMVF